MKRLEQLPEIVEESLSGLTAGQNLKYRIERAAREQEHRKPALRGARAWVPAVCCALALAVAGVFLSPMLNGTGRQTESLISTQAAGTVSRMPHMRALLDLTGDNVTVGASNDAPAYRSLWAKGSNGNFPLIGVNGRYYRLMTSPDSVSDSILGQSVGTISEYTTEPSLSGTDVILSNVAAQGADVYEVSGMGGTMVAADVDGSKRLFQRVSYNGSAVVGSEGLGDTLQISGHVLALELSGVGTVTDASAAQTLVDTLLDNAVYESSGSVSGKQSLLISLDNGLTVQMAVKNDKLSACGTWSCPDFFDAFQAAIQ